MRQINAEDIGKLLLRLAIGGLLLFHVNGFFHGDRGIPTVVAAWGLPAFFAYIGIGLELIGALLVLFGFYTQIGALALTTFMLAALLMVHVTEIAGIRGSGAHFFLLGTNPAGVFDKYFLETQMLYLLGAIAIALLGAGRCSLSYLLKMDYTFGRRPGTRGATTSQLIQ